MSTLADAKQCLQDRDFDRAEEIFQELLQCNPENAEAWHLRGIYHAEHGCLEEAAECLEKATELDDLISLYHYNLGLVYKMLGELDRAIDSYRIAIERKDDFLEAHNNLGTALIAQRRDLEAADCFRGLVRRFPASSDSHFNLANTLQDIGRTDEAVKHFRCTIELQPDHGAARENLGRALTDAGREDEAREAWEQWLAADPDNGIPHHMLSALTGTETPLRCDDDYIRETFDQGFAVNFEEQLTRLEYQSPTLVGKALDAIDRPLTDLRVLDAGCGTGLCGPIVRPMATHLVGVDLSAAMLDQARKRDVYDEMFECEITDFMNMNSAGFDLIISSDTLCYFGDLSEVLSAATKSLKDNGIMVFSVESASTEHKIDSFKLQKHGRYCHAETYVRQVVEEAGLTLCDITTDVQRLEGGRPVNGFVVTAVQRKRSAGA